MAVRASVLTWNIYGVDTTIISHFDDAFASAQIDPVFPSGLIWKEQ